MINIPVIIYACSLFLSLQLTEMILLGYKTSVRPLRPYRSFHTVPPLLIIWYLFVQRNFWKQTVTHVIKIMNLFKNHLSCPLPTPSSQALEQEQSR